MSFRAFGSFEELQQGFFLFIEFGEHQFELCAVLRHEVGLSFCQQRTVLAYVVDFVGGQFCHFVVLPAERISSVL